MTVQNLYISIDLSKYFINLSKMFDAGGQLVFTGGQNYLN